MKAINLIKLLQEQIDKHGEDIEVFIEAPGMNYEKTFTTKDYIRDYVCIDEDLDTYPTHLIMEKHGDDRGIIYGVEIVGGSSVSFHG
jgi:hypothetical protein